MGRGEPSEVMGALPSRRLLDLRCSGSDALTVTRYSASPLRNLRRPRRCSPPASGFVLRRISPVAAHSGDRLLSEPTAGIQSCRREPLFMAPKPPFPSGREGRPTSIDDSNQGQAVEPQTELVWIPVIELLRDETEGRKRKTYWAAGIAAAAPGVAPMPIQARWRTAPWRLRSRHGAGLLRCRRPALCVTTGDVCSPYGPVWSGMRAPGYWPLRSIAS
jgi:hypothetical protein